MRRFGVVTEEQQEERGDWYLAKQIAAGILIAAAVIFVAIHLYLWALARVATEAVQHVQAQVQTDMARSSTEMRARMDAQQQERQRREAEVKRAQLEANATQVRAQADRARSEQEQAARKRVAWEAFYKPRQECDDPKDWDTQVACGNAHIKAKKEFESRWTTGEIQ